MGHDVQVEVRLAVGRLQPFVEHAPEDARADLSPDRLEEAAFFVADPRPVPPPEEERTDHDRLRKDRYAGEGGDLERCEDLLLGHARVFVPLDVARLPGDKDEVPGPVVDLDRPAAGEVALRGGVVVARERQCPFRVEQVGQPHVEVEQVDRHRERRLEQFIQRERRGGDAHDLVQDRELPV
ncbi:hypothetical protein DSECCO2_648860 [anaerobic digester metagenome]